MKKMFSFMLACTFACLSAGAATPDNVVTTDEANSQEVQLTAHTSVPIKAMVNSYVTYGGDDYTSTEIIDPIKTHLNKRFAGREVKGVTREGHTYLVDLGDGLHVRYDNCGNPVCYGNHNHDCNHCNH